MTAFEVSEFVYRYPGGASPSLGRVTFSIGEGEFVLVTGPSGGGKTTLARALAGLVPEFFGGAVGGRISCRGVPLGCMGRRAFHASVGIVLQDPERQILMSGVERELAFGLENLCIPSPRMESTIRETAALLGLAGHLGFRTEELSGGMLQRTVIAAVLAMGPRILILDEPTSQLDPGASADLLALLRRLRERHGCTIVLVEHRIGRSLPLADRVMFLKEGAIVFDGAPCDYRKWAASNAPFYLPAFRPLRTPPRAAAPPPGGAVAELRAVSFAYAGRCNALKGVSFSVRAGEFVSVLGANGAGKSTMLKILCGLLAPSEGTARLMGCDPRVRAGRDRASLVGYCPQNPADFLFNDTVAGEVGYTLRAAGRFAGEAVREALAQWELSPLAERNPRELSAGERQRVALAAATVGAPTLLLLDEPTRGQDPATAAALGRRLAVFAAERGAAVVAVTQDQDFAATWAHRAVVLRGGEIAADGDAREVIGGNF